MTWRTRPRETGCFTAIGWARWVAQNGAKATSPDRAVVGSWTCRAIAKTAITSEDGVQEVVHDFCGDSFESLAPRYAEAPTTKVHLAGSGRHQADRLGQPTEGR